MIFKLPSNPEATFDIIKKIPEKPGVYLFLDKNKKPIYIGKAVNLKNRILSHFAKTTRDEKRLFQIAKYIKNEIIDSDVAALIKESELIKKFQPKLNIVFRDDKQYFYLCFSDELFPRISVRHQQKDLCLGPYTDGRALKSSLSLVRRAFPFCSCKTPHLRQCLNSQIGLCFGFCCQKNHPATKKEIEKYQDSIRKIKKIFSGPHYAKSFGGARHDKTLKKEIQKKLRLAVKNQDFDTAQALKLQLQGLEKVFSHRPHLSEKQSFNLRELENLTSVKSINRIEFFDSSQLQGSHRVAAMTVWQNNRFDKTDWRLFKIKNEKAIDDLAMLKEVFERRLNHPEWRKPDLAIIDGGKNQLKTALAVFGPAKIRTISLTKNNRHQPEFLLIPNLPLHLKKSVGASQPIKAHIVSLKKISPLLKNFLEDFSDKTHGFAVRFHRKRRYKI